MCGPIAMMLPVDRKNPAKQTLQIMVYHIGRLSAYALMGLVFGIIGKGLLLAGIQQRFSIVAGVLMIAIIVLPEKTVARYNFSKPVHRLISNIKTTLGSQFRKSGTKALYITGLMNGFLPCGLVYAALFGALAMQNPTEGTLYMILYGLGTVPLMSAVVYMAGLLKNSTRSAFSKAVPFLGILIGMLFIARGLALDIPYISPDNLSLYIQKAPNCK